MKLLLQRDLSYKDYTPIGTVEFVKTFAEKVGIKLPDPIHAEDLMRLEGRVCWGYLCKRLKDEFDYANGQDL